MPKLDNETARAVNKAEGSATTLVDEDEYVLKLDKVVVSPKPDTNGNQYWVWTFTIQSGEITKDKFKGKSQRTQTGWAENQHWFAKMVFDAFGVKPNVDTDTILGHEVKALIGQREIQKGSRKGQLANDIQQLMPLDAGGDKGDDWADDSKDGDPAADDDF